MGTKACLTMATMNARRFFWILTAATALLPGCRNTGVDAGSRIPVLEQELEAAYNPAKADSLVDLYRQQVQAHPDDHANNTRYLTRTAEILYFRREDAAGAVLTLYQAVREPAPGTDLTEPVGLLTRIWTAYQNSSPSARLSPADTAQMRATLLQHRNWIDTGLVRLDHDMGSAATSNRSQAELFVQTAEGCARLLRQAEPETAADLLMKAAGVAKNIGDFNKAIQLYRIVSDELQPAPAKASTALFMQGFVYENDLADLEKAKSIYQDFLKRYPKDEFADDAQQALKMLGKSPEDIIREFERKNPSKKQ
jgi:tetratricopeptide (TPR) repeat protein